jgi:hypothetical protein
MATTVQGAPTNGPLPVLLKLMVPVGGVGVSGPVSFTVAVQVVGWVGATVAGVQLTLVVVVSTTVTAHVLAGELACVGVAPTTADSKLSAKSSEATPNQPLRAGLPVPDTFIDVRPAPTVFREIGRIWPLLMTHPCGANLRPNMRISPRNGVDIKCSFWSGLESCYKWAPRAITHRCPD